MRRKRWPIVVAVLGSFALFAVIAASAVVVARSGGRSAANLAGWDERVHFAVQYVEKYKGEPFRRPVTVVFQSDAEFEQGVISDEEPSAEDRKKADQQAGLLRALGLLQGDIDPFAEQDTLDRSNILAYYESDTKTVKVKGTEIDVPMKATLVHELTHAWQDQYFDIARRQDVTESEAQLGYKTVIEGDAERVRTAWVNQLPAAQYQEYERWTEEEANGSGTPADPSGRNVNGPSPFLALHQAQPYWLGPVFLDGLEADGGPDQVDAALATPPPDSATILQPWRYGRSTARGPAVLPPVAPGRTAVYEDSLGALDLYLMLADRIDPRKALEASDGWRADRFRVVTAEDGGVCVEGRIDVADQGSAGRLTAALIDWDEHFANSRFTLHPDDAGVAYEACDPGKDVMITVPGRPFVTIGLPMLRLYAWSDALEAGDDEAKARCQAGVVVENVTLADLESDEPFSADGYETLLDTAAERCR